MSTTGAASLPHRNFFDDYLDEPPSTTTTAEAQNDIISQQQHGAPLLATNGQTSSAQQHIPASHLMRNGAGNEQAAWEVLESLHHQTVGNYDIITTPFGPRKITYADWTASGRGLQPIEDYIQHEILPTYANTHTTSSTTGLQTTLFRHEARDIVRRVCRGSLTEDTVLFCGSGATAAINTAINALRVKEIADYCKLKNLPLPVVLLGPFEHHSNILPWRESGAIVLTIPERFTAPITLSKNAIFATANEDVGEGNNNSKTNQNHHIVDLYSKTNNNNNDTDDEYITFNDADQQTGWISQSYLKYVLQYITQQYHAALCITAFSAASNVTGKVEDSTTLTAIAKSYGALTVWDYASCASSLKIDMNPYNLEHYKKDIVFFSPHKFLGGAATPGVLIIKNYILSQSFNPSVHTGGGTVFFSNPKEHIYLNNFHEREEAGTPDIIGSIRCGLIMQLKEQLSDVPTKRCNLMTKAVLNILSKHPFIHIMDHDVILNNNNLAHLNTKNNHTGVISLIMYTTPLGINNQNNNNNNNQKNTLLMLPPQFISALLNDLFGIQTRAGCLCAGPYLHNLLGIDDEQSDTILNHLYQKQEDMRPGVVRISLHYSMPLYVLEYITKALLFVATQGIKFLPLYKCVISSGEWKHFKRRTREETRRWLGSNLFTPNGLKYYSQRQTIFGEEELLLKTNQNQINNNNTNNLITPQQQYNSNQTNVNQSMQREAVVLSKYLDLAEKMVVGLNCEYQYNIPTIALDDNNTNNDILVDFEKMTTFTLNDEKLLTTLFQHTIDELKELQQLTPITTNGNNTTTTTPQQQQQHEYNLLLNEIVQQQSNIISTDDNQAQQTLLTLLPSTYPAHPNDEPAKWFITPDVVLQHIKNKTFMTKSTLNKNVMSDDINTVQDLNNNADGDIATYYAKCYTLHYTLLASISSNTDNNSNSTKNILCNPAQQAHPGTRRRGGGCCDNDSNNNNTPSQQLKQHFINFINSQQKQQQDKKFYKVFTINNNNNNNNTAGIDAFKISAQYPPRGSPWGAVVKTVNNFIAKQNNNGEDGDDVDNTLCLNCWHHHPIAPTTGQARECISCECVHFRSTQNSQHAVINSNNNNNNNSTKQNNNNNNKQQKKNTQQQKQQDTTSPIIAQPQSTIITPSASTQAENTTTSTALTTTTQTQTTGNAMSKKDSKALYRRLLGKTLSAAMIDFEMINPGDRVLVGVSGGKDSLSLIHALLELQRSLPFKFEIAACTIDPMSAEFDPSPLKDYFASLGVTYHYESIPIMQLALEMQAKSNRFSVCSFCARLKRGVLYSTCRKHNYNVLALGQHLDDFAESFIMSAFHNGALNTMKPNYWNNTKDIRVIRPLCYTREAKTREFANIKQLPIVTDNCPACFEASLPTERARVKTMLAAQEVIHPMLFQRLLSAMKPLMFMAKETTPADKAAVLVKLLSHMKGDDEKEEENDDDVNKIVDGDDTTTIAATKQQQQKGGRRQQQREQQQQQQQQDNKNKVNNNDDNNVEIIADDEQKVVVVNNNNNNNTNNTSTQQNNNSNNDTKNVKINDIMADIDLTALIAEGRQSGDEECAECVDIGGGLFVCPPGKGKNKMLMGEDEDNDNDENTNQEEENKNNKNDKNDEDSSSNTRKNKRARPNDMKPPQTSDDDNNNNNNNINTDGTTKQKDPAHVKTQLGNTTTTEDLPN